MQYAFLIAEETDEKEDQSETDGQEYTKGDKEDPEEDIEGSKENKDDGPSEPHDSYEEWSDWSNCNHHEHYKFRTRRCKYNQPDCSSLPENTREVENCQEWSGDEGLGEWINQGACQVGARQCGAGEQMKVRQCYLDQPRLV